MNIIRKTIAIASGAVLSLGFALPVAALNVDGTVNSATQGMVQVGNEANADVSAQADADVDIGAGSETSGTTSDADARASGSANANAGVSIQPLVITRADVDAGTVEATISSPSAVATRAQLSGYAAAEMKADSNIASIEAASDNVAVTYTQKAKLLGFIPVMVNATATVDAAGNVEVSYPWYAFLMVTNKADLEARIQDGVNAELGANGTLNAGADAGKNGVVSGNASVQ